MWAPTIKRLCLAILFSECAHTSDRSPHFTTRAASTCQAPTLRCISRRVGNVKLRMPDADSPPLRDIEAVAMLRSLRLSASPGKAREDVRNVTDRCHPWFSEKEFIPCLTTGRTSRSYCIAFRPFRLRVPVARFLLDRPPSTRYVTA